MRHFTHLTWNNRLQMEAFLKAGMKPGAIADELGVHISTVYREMKRGCYEHLNTDYTTEMRYSPDKAEEKYRFNLTAKGAPLKIGNDNELADFIEKKIINDNYSPAAALAQIELEGKQFSVTICTTTLYSYIDKGVFLNLTNKNLPLKRGKKREYNKVEQKRAPKGKSIEARPKEVAERNTFGHWEMDTVKGKRGGERSCLLVLTERLTREEIIRKMADGTAESVVKTLDLLERKYGKRFKEVFKTITVDNGSEFADCIGIERSVYGKRNRTTLYYCHPYSSYERGSNENQNKMIRRHIPKGKEFDGVSEQDVSAIESWINNYPRKIFGYSTSERAFSEYISAIFGGKK